MFVILSMGVCNTTFGCLVFVGGDNVVRNFRGFKLRDLKSFYKANKCEDIDKICNLYRQCGPDGRARWTRIVQPSTSTFSHYTTFTTEGQDDIVVTKDVKDDVIVQETRFECVVWRKVRSPFRFIFCFILFNFVSSICRDFYPHLELLV